MVERPRNQRDRLLPSAEFVRHHLSLVLGAARPLTTLTQQKQVRVLDVRMDRWRD
jgi:hypothetical protein